MLQMQDIVPVPHHLENVLENLRQQKFIFPPLLGHIIKLSLDEIKNAFDKTFAGQGISPQLKYLGNALERISLSNDNDRTEAMMLTLKLLDPLDEIKLDAKETDTEVVPSEEPAQASPPLEIPATEAQLDTIEEPYIPPMQADLQFFSQLSNIIEARLHSASGKTERILKMALTMNRIADEPVDSNQLEAAIYLHDLGLSQYPLQLTQQGDILATNANLPLKSHNLLAANFLSQLPDWTMAGRILNELQEWHNGSGYPRALTDNNICDGAKILAIVLTFEAFMHEGPAQKHSSRTLIAAIMKVNRFSGSQFSERWVEIFNTVAKEMYQERPI